MTYTSFRRKSQPTIKNKSIGENKGLSNQEINRSKIANLCYNAQFMKKQKKV